MKSRNVLIGLGVAAALAAGVGAYSYNAIAQGGPGYGPGWMMGGGGPRGMMDEAGAVGPVVAQRIVRRSGKTAGPVPDKVTARVITCAVGAAVTAPA